ncbi:hypothetical protein WISP_54320 [Willisornis vidua]|uniref:Reverse transcriptase domain-containing protein n=1 Tax=Willisornis vidua TaxID=1566151 RepID=A0ABQ9DCN6_9PASS|nr:hypothetical protein WISP_54320 [Willisornis vidua]
MDAIQLLPVLVVLTCLLEASRLEVGKPLGGNTDGTLIIDNIISLPLIIDKAAVALAFKVALFGDWLDINLLEETVKDIVWVMLDEDNSSDEQLAHKLGTKSYSECGPVTGGILQGSIFSPVLFNIFINNLDTGLEGILLKFANYSKLGDLNSLKGREILQRDLDELERWAITSCMKLNKGKCLILHLEWGKSRCMHRMGNEMLESSAMEKNLRSPGRWQFEYDPAVPWQPGRPTMSWGASGTASSAG